MAVTSFHQRLVILLVASSALSIQSSVGAFAPHRPRSSFSSPSSVSVPGSTSRTRAASPYSAQSSLSKLRGGGQADQDGATAPADNHPSISSAREESLSSIKYCSRAALLSVAVQLLSAGAAAPTGGWNGALASGPSTWLDFVDRLQSLNLVAFGVGLWSVSTCYEAIFAANPDPDGRGFNKSGAQVPYGSILDIFRSYRWMYRTAAWTVVALSMRLAGKVLGGIYGSHVAAAVYGPGLVVILAIFGSVYVRTKFVDEAAGATVEETKRGGTAPSPGSPAAEAREVGIYAARNMALCSGSFALFAVLSFVFWFTVIVPGPEATLFVKIATVNKFLTHVALCGLLRNMDNRFLDAAVAATATGDRKQDIFRMLFEAEKGFYRKAGKVLMSSAALDALRLAVPAVIGAFKG